MKYYKIPVVEGTNFLDADDTKVYESHFYFDGSYAFCVVDDSAIPRVSWLVITRVDIDNYLLSLNKKTLEQIKTDKIVELEELFNNSFTVFQSNALGSINTYPINQEAQDNLKILENRMMANPNKNVFTFYTLEARNYVDHTRDQFIKLVDDAEAFRVAQGRKLNTLMNQVEDIFGDETLTDDEKQTQIEAITWS